MDNKPITDKQIIEIKTLKTIHDGRDCSAVSLPHTAEPWLASKIPQLYRDIPLGHFPHIEPHLQNPICSVIT